MTDENGGVEGDGAREGAVGGDAEQEGVATSAVGPTMAAAEEVDPRAYDASLAPGHVHARDAGLLRRLYDWVVGWADRPGGEAALGTLSFAESSFFPIPPDPLLLALCVGRPSRALRFAAVCTAASVLGGLAGYLIGWGAWSAVDTFFFDHVPGVTPESFAEVGALYDRWGFLAVFTAGLTPIPYKVFTLSSGVFGISLPIFLLASGLSRGLRFFVLAALIKRYGAPIQRFIDRYFTWLAWAFIVLLVGGFLLIEYVR
ncbi:MAG TPA: YqaA family protein [Longimicrobiales bacterium]|nr:YqaA family protein [Longimicrobiales bacterium]